MSKFATFVNDPIGLIRYKVSEIQEKRLEYLLKPEVYNKLPDKKAIKIKYKFIFGKYPDLRHPKTFNEKLQWLKLYNRKPEYTTMVDKYEVKKYVADIIGEEYIIPTYGVWDRAEDIDFDKLPNQFVLKCTHDSGSVIICEDKKQFDCEAAKVKLNECLKKNLYLWGREWPYKNVKPRIIAEKYITNTDEVPEDYKIHNFNGVPKVILVCRDRYKNTGMTEDFFTAEWEHLDVKRPGKENSESPILCPAELEEMLDISKKLSKDFPFLRTDFYTIQHHVYFGELTFYPSSGLTGFIPQKYDDIFGDWINLPVRGGIY